MKPGRAVLLSLLLALPAAAQMYTGEVTPFIGYQTGGSLILAGREAPLDSAPVVGVTLTFDRGPGRKLDILFAHQTTDAVRTDPYGPPPARSAYRTYIDYLQLGGRYIYWSDPRVDAYVAMTAGGTWVGLGGEGAVGFSFAYGGGADVRLTHRTSIRFDGRFTSTTSLTGGAYHCDSSGTCSGFTTGNVVTQFTASTGLVLRF